MYLVFVAYWVVSQLILGFGVEIMGTKLKLRKVVRESLVIAHVKVPKNPRPGFPFIAKIQDGRHEIIFLKIFSLHEIRKR